MQSRAIVNVEHTHTTVQSEDPEEFRTLPLWMTCYVSHAGTYLQGSPRIHQSLARAVTPWSLPRAGPRNSQAQPACRGRAQGREDVLPGKKVSAPSVEVACRDDKRAFVRAPHRKLLPCFVFTHAQHRARHRAWEGTAVSRTTPREYADLGDNVLASSPGSQADAESVRAVQPVAPGLHRRERGRASVAAGTRPVAGRGAASEINP